MPPTPDLEAAGRTADLIERIGRLVRSGRKAGGLNPLEWETLQYLGRANRYSRNPGGLASWLGVSKGRASQLVEALAKRGLILRLPNPRDGRGLALDLTNAGRRTAERDPLHDVARAVAGLAAADGAATAETLAEALTATLAVLQRANGNRAFGQCSQCRHFLANDAPGETGGPHRCGLTREPLNRDEPLQICGEFETKDAA